MTQSMNEKRDLHKKPLVMTIANRKGGVSKTTTCVNLAYAYSQKGYKVLVIDADPQGSLTQMLGIDRNIGNSPELSIRNLSDVSKKLRESENETYPVDDLFGYPTNLELETTDYKGLHDLISKVYYGNPLSRKDVESAIITPTYKIEIPKKEQQQEEQAISIGDVQTKNLKTKYRKYKFGFDVIVATEELTDDELVIALDDNDSRRKEKGYVLHNIVKQIAYYMDYEIILLDTGPSLSVLTLNALAAATDGIIVSASIDEQSLWSLQKFKVNIRSIKQQILPHDGLLGVVLSPRDARSQLYPIIAYKITQVLNMYLFKTTIPRSSNAQKAVTSGLLFAMLDERAYNAYQELADEILDRQYQNHLWEQQRNRVIVATIKKLRSSSQAYKNMSNEDIYNEVRKKFSDGELWRLPTNEEVEHMEEYINAENI